MSTSTIAPQRDLFSVPEAVCYLNCAYMSPQLRAATEAGREAAALKSQPWQLRPEHWFGQVEEARACFAAVMGCTADDVALVPSASYGIATAVRNTRIDAGQTLVLLDEQFPSCVYPWRRLAAETGARVVTVPRPGDDDWTAAILESIESHTGLVAVPGFHWAEGGRIDLAAVGEAARRVGARFVVDLSQSAGACPIDLAAVDPDWLCAPAYKWLLGPYSTGFLYVAPRNHDGIPLEENWIARRGSEDFSRLVDYQDEYREGARRYDMGQRSNFVLLPMVLAGLEQLLAWEVPRIAESLGVLTARLEEIAAGHGFRALPEALRAPHILGLKREGGLPADLLARLREHDVYMGIRGDALRVSPHLHVTDADLERFRAALASIF